MTDDQKRLANARLDLLALARLAEYAIKHALKHTAEDRRVAEHLLEKIETVGAQYE